MVDVYKKIGSSVYNSADAGKVLVSSNDACFGYLEDKISVTGTGLSISTINEGVDEEVQIALVLPATASTYLELTDTPAAFVANNIPVTNTAGDALINDSDLTYNQSTNTFATTNIATTKRRGERRFAQ